MGMGISFFVERRINDRWVVVKSPRPEPEDFDLDTGEQSASFAHVGRGMPIFAALAGKPEWCKDLPCCPVIPAVDGRPKGLPRDLSLEVAQARTLGDAYAVESWHLLPVLAAYEWERIHAEDMRSIVDEMLAIDADPSNVRAVFWFSN